MKQLSYNVIFKPEVEGGFTVIVPALPGCVSYGKNLTQARTMARDAITAYLTSLKKHRESIPVEDDSFMTSIQVNGIRKQVTYA
ncbi:MAG: type II toxin-antitoxin system HicB family antitoxin [Patescibacteria group bacterium]